MNIGVAFNKLSEFLSSRLSVQDDNFTHVAFDVLKTMMLLAAVDGNIAREEMARFWECAMEIGRYDKDDLRELWKSALSSAGYLSLHAKLVDEAACTAEFLRLVDEGLVKKLAKASATVRKRAFDCLRSMANADGDFSSVERSCIKALVDRLDKMGEQRVVSAVRL